MLPQFQRRNCEAQEGDLGVRVEQGRHVEPLLGILKFSFLQKDSCHIEAAAEVAGLNPQPLIVVVQRMVTHVDHLLAQELSIDGLG